MLYWYKLYHLTLLPSYTLAITVPAIIFCFSWKKKLDFFILVPFNKLDDAFVTHKSTTLQ